MSAQHVVTAVMSSWGFNFYPLILLNSRIESNIKLNGRKCTQSRALFCRRNSSESKTGNRRAGYFWSPVSYLLVVSSGLKISKYRCDKIILSFIVWALQVIQMSQCVSNIPDIGDQDQDTIHTMTDRQSFSNKAVV